MTGIDAVRERRFRRLLRAYPSWYREQRGEEMLTTLMDVAGDRDRPTAGQRVDACLGGLRKHLSAGSVKAGVVAVLVALFAATLGAVAGQAAGWHTAAELPNGRAADRLAAQAVPDLGNEVFDYEFRSLFAWQDMEGKPHNRLFLLGRGDNYSAGELAYELEHRPDDFDRLTTARDRLADAGWTVGPTTRTDSDSREFNATRDGLTMTVSASKNTGWDEVKSSMTSVEVHRTTPAAVPVLTVAGFVAGALAGWLLTCRLRHRVLDWPQRRRGATAVPLWIAAAMLALPTLITLSLVGISLQEPQARIAAWQGYTWDPPAYLTFIGLAALAIALAAALLDRYRPYSRPQGYYRPVDSGTARAQGCDRS